ncbi:hypothetical protein RRG08_066770 [Elysia crispata]|uniref:Uncharacterized protein n=1 Tax=Elysia crispata TaxID=231223 RepID=A0AAE0XPB9_9GAST|nr:hypothetical protein RRG08_066770 [Elysia crispata]
MCVTDRNMVHKAEDTSPGENGELFTNWCAGRSPRTRNTCVYLSPPAGFTQRPIATGNTAPCDLRDNCKVLSQSRSHCKKPQFVVP